MSSLASPSVASVASSTAAPSPVIECLVAVEDARVFNSGTVYMRHAVPAYVKPFLACLRGLAAGAEFRYSAVTFNREADGRDFCHLTPEPLESEEALLKCLGEVAFQRYPDPSRTERIPVGHLSQLLSKGAAGSDRHLLLIIHSQLEEDMGKLKEALEPMTSLTVLSPRNNSQLEELFNQVNGPGDLGQSGTQPHPKWEVVLVPKCIRLSPPQPPPQPTPQPPQTQQQPVMRLPAGTALMTVTMGPNGQTLQMNPLLAGGKTFEAVPSPPQPQPQQQPPRPQLQPLQVQQAPAPDRVVWSGRLQFSKPDLCPPTTVQFVQLGMWSIDWNFRCFDQPRPCATCATLKPEIALAIEQICQGVQYDQLIVRPASQTEVSPLLRLFESAANGPPPLALIFCDLKGPKPGPGLARCLVARFDPKVGHIIASIPRDQEKFLKDVQTRFQKQQQQQPQQPQPPPPPPQPPQQPLQTVTVSQPQVIMYMPQQHQQMQQPLHQLASKMPSVYTTPSHHQHQPAPTIVVNPVPSASGSAAILTSSGTGGGPPPAKMGRLDVVGASGYQPGLRVMTMSQSGQFTTISGQQSQPAAPVTVQRLALPIASYQQHQPMGQQQQQQHLVITQQTVGYQHQLMQQQPF